jgi:hypothetical protein
MLAPRHRQDQVRRGPRRFMSLFLRTLFPKDNAELTAPLDPRNGKPAGPAPDSTVPVQLGGGNSLGKGFPVRGSSEFPTRAASALITIGKGWGVSSWTNYYGCSQSSASCFLSVLRSRQPTPRAGSTRLRQCIRTNCRLSRALLDAFGADHPRAVRRFFSVPCCKAVISQCFHRVFLCSRAIASRLLF